MSGNGEWPGWVLGLGGVLTAVGTAWATLTKGRKRRPESDGSMETWQRQVESTLRAHETRLDRFEVDRKEDREDFGRVFNELEALNRSLARIEGALNIPRNGR